MENRDIPGIGETSFRLKFEKNWIKIKKKRLPRKLKKKRKKARMKWGGLILTERRININRKFKKLYRTSEISHRKDETINKFI